MNRRQVLLSFGALALSGVQVSQASDRYKTLKTPIGVRENDGTIEVLEFFWFGCPHCYAFEPTINEWVANKPPHVRFVREAPPLNPGWTAHSQAFYAAEALGVTEQFFEPMFHQIHRHKKPLRKPRQIAAFAGELGLDEDKFLKTMKSFSVDAGIRRAMSLARGAQITGVPSILVNGKYTTGSSQAGGHDGIIRVIDELVDREWQQQKA